MVTKQFCNDCVKQSICPKATHFENYSLDGCSDFLEKNIETEENDNEEGVQTVDLESYEL